VNPIILARRQRALPTQFVDNSVGTFRCDRHVTGNSTPYAVCMISSQYGQPVDAVRELS
jgi:hypothetical protein